MLNVGIIGVTGYAGAELLRLLLMHPGVNVTNIVSHSYSNKAICDIYPNLYSNSALICKELDTFMSESMHKCDVVFAALPHGLSEALAVLCYEQNVVFIDLGADFRLVDEEKYKSWYGLEYKHKRIHDSAVYGLSELYRDAIKGSKIIGNPGCYPTSIILGLAPALRNGFIDTSSIIIDSKSGLTGAGRELAQSSHYVECNESMMAYKIAKHRHTPEIEQELSRISKTEITVSFTPHLIPINRGILSTIYANLNVKLQTCDLIELYKNFYIQDPFVRILDQGKSVEIRSVRGSNFCDIGLVVDERTNRLIIVSTIDNMVKGCAGQAIQNMNIVFGLKEDTGLEYIPIIF
jgi:N-acetyl-gamma-glutamyl-phosphate reductase